MSLRLNGSTSGYTEIDAPAVAGSNTLKLPTGNGSDGNILGTDGAGNLSWVGGRMVLETAKASTSGTSVDFTGIPSWVKRITVMFSGVSTNGSSNLICRIGDGSVVSSGYASGTARVGASGTGATSTAGYLLTPDNGSSVTTHGQIVVFNISGNSWTSSFVLSRSDDVFTYLGGGSVTLSGTLDRIRITTVNGTDTFDAGSVNLLLEG
jgi:hypothetical protein